MHVSPEVSSAALTGELSGFCHCTEGFGVYTDLQLPDMAPIVRHRIGST